MRPYTYLLLAAITLASCGGDKQTDAEQLAKLKKERTEIDVKIAKLESNVVDTTRKPVAVVVMDLQPANFTAFIEVQASIIGDENVYANAQAPGNVTNVLVKPGQRVSRGQVMATLDAAAIEQQISGIDAQVQLTKSLYDKQQKLWAQNIGTEVQLLTAKTNYEATLKQKQSLIAQRNMYRIVSPISGVVDMVDAKIGQMSGAQMPGSGIRVVNNSKLKAEARLGENYLGKVKTGDPVTLVLPDINDSLSTKLSYVAQSVDAVSRSFNVEVRLGSDRRLHPNMSCKMKIANYQSKDALVVPASVIQKTAEGDMVYVAEGNIARSRLVEVGRISNGMAEITNGLSAGDKVIVKGFEEADNGEKISIQ